MPEEFSQKIQLHRGLERPNSCLCSSLSAASLTPIRHPLRGSPSCCPSWSPGRSDRCLGRCSPRCSDRYGPNRRPGCSQGRCSRCPVRCSRSRSDHCGLSRRPRCSRRSPDRCSPDCSENRFPSCPPVCSVHCGPGCRDSPSLASPCRRGARKATESPGLSDHSGIRQRRTGRVALPLCEAPGALVGFAFRQ